MTEIVWVGLLACAASGLLVGALLPVLRRWAKDVPGERSSHTVVIPRGAGLAVALDGGVVVLEGGFHLERNRA